MEIVKIPRMEKHEYDRLIERNHLCRIAFQGEEFPYIAPFMYSFDGHYLYFLSTKYGKKIDLFRKNPAVAVEIEEYARDLSAYSFVTLRGRLEEVMGKEARRSVKSGSQRCSGKVSSRPTSWQHWVMTPSISRRHWSGGNGPRSGNWRESGRLSR